MKAISLISIPDGLFEKRQLMRFQAEFLGECSFVAVVKPRSELLADPDVLPGPLKGLCMRLIPCAAQRMFPKICIVTV